MKRTVALLVGGFLSGCTSIGTFSAVDLPETEEMYVSGSPSAISERAGSRVAIGPVRAAHNAAERPLFVVLIENLGGSPVNVGPENIVVRTDTGLQLAAISAEQLEREAQKEAKNLALAASLQAVGNSMQASSAGYQSGTATYSGTASAYGSGGYATGNTYGTTTYSGYDSGAAAQARATADAQNRALIAQTRSEIDTVLANSQRGAFQRQTIYPGANYISDLTFEKLPKDTRMISLQLSVGEDTHVFAWNYLVE